MRTKGRGEAGREGLNGRGKGEVCKVHRNESCELEKERYQAKGP